MPDEKKSASDLKAQQIKDLTEQRNQRCQPVVLAILKSMLDNDLLLADRFYVQQAVQQSLDTVWRSIVTQHVNTVFEEIEKSLVRATNDACKLLWKGKDSQDVSLNEIDKVLKSDTKKVDKQIPLEPA